MRLQILSIPNCANVAALRQRLAALAADRVDVSVTEEIIDTPKQATRAGMNGSPTLLIDGADPFAEQGQTPSLSCRLYHDENGDPTGAPSMVQLRLALNASASVEGLRTWRARTAPQDPQARAVHQAILRAFANTGHPPTAAILEGLMASIGDTSVGAILRQLHDADVIRLDPAGAVDVAYPFSTRPTRHRVRLASGVEVHAMCAIDALGIPAMLATDATITSIDPVSNEPVTISVHDWHYTWDPATAVVFYSAAAGSGPSADCCCNDLNAFTSPATARAWMSAHPHTAGELLETAAAVRLGRHVFAALLGSAED